MLHGHATYIATIQICSFLSAIFKAWIDYNFSLNDQCITNAWVPVLLFSMLATSTQMLAKNLQNQVHPLTVSKTVFSLEVNFQSTVVVGNL